MVETDTPEKMRDALRVLAAYGTCTWVLGNGRPFYSYDGDEIVDMDPALALMAMRDDLISYEFDAKTMTFTLRLSRKGAEFVLSLFPGLKRVFDMYVKEEGTV